MKTEERSLCSFCRKSVTGDIQGITCLTKFGLKGCIGSREIMNRIRKVSGNHSTFLDIYTSSKHPFRHISNNIRDDPGRIQISSYWARGVEDDLASACDQLLFWRFQ